MALVFACSATAFGQVGIGTTAPHASSELDLGSGNKALYLNRVANTAAVANPQPGMMIYDLSEHCVKVFEGTPAKWSDCLGGQAMHLACDAASFSGPVFQNNAYSGTLTIPYTGGKGTAYPAQSFTENGLTFTLSAGNFSNGAGDIVYTVSGTAPSSGNFPITIAIGGQSCSVTLSVIATVSNPPGTVASLTCASAIFSPATATQGTAYTGTLTMPYTGGNGGTYPAQNFTANGLTFTLPAGNFAAGSGNVQFSITGTPTTATAISGDITVGGQTCSLTLPVSQSPTGVLDPRIVLAQDRKHFIASVYDNDYLPYTAPSVPATLERPKAADGANEAELVDVQGSITTAGFQVQIPATVTGTGTSSIQAWTSTFVVPAAYTQDGNSRTLELSWVAQSFTATTTFITATIKSIGGDLLAKKLDINAGIGNDYLGWLMGQFQYPYNAAGATTSYQVRDIPGIPDRMFGVPDGAGDTTTHLMLYLPVQTEDGSIFLNNNLGADYANLKSLSFNLTQQATSIAMDASDPKAKGSFFQWGRRGDGHELMAWTSSSQYPTPVYSTASTSTNTRADVPNHRYFIKILNPNDWRVNSNPNLWNGVNAINNPCPHGFRVPHPSERNNIWAANVNILKIPSVRGRIAGLDNSYNTAAQGYGRTIWSDYVSRGTNPANYADAERIDTSASSSGGSSRSNAFPVRCIKD